MQHRFICFIHVAVGNGAASHCFSAASPLHRATPPSRPPGVAEFAEHRWKSL